MSEQNEWVWGKWEKQGFGMTIQLTFVHESQSWMGTCCTVVRH